MRASSSWIAGIVLICGCPDPTPGAGGAAGKPMPAGSEKVVANKGVAPYGAAVQCNVSAFKPSDWLHPNPVEQLGAVPVKGKPALPSSKEPGTSDNCDFHIFSWQWFLYLMNPSKGQSGPRHFEDRSLYPVVDADTCASVNAKKGVASPAQRRWSPSVLKVNTMPDVPGQAGTGDALYDKNTNLVFYNRSFTTNECGVYADGNFPNAAEPNPAFPTQVNQVAELKSSWRVLEATDEASNYYTQQADIEGIGPKKLGLVGFHVVVNTGAHPEFVWATFEHVDNAPGCQVVLPEKGFSRQQPKAGWSFVSSECNACVSSHYQDGTDLRKACDQECQFGKGASKPVYDSQGNALVKGGPGQKPSNICIDAYYGESPEPQNASNVANIQYLNTLLVGPEGLLTQLPASDPLAVFKNYYLGGAQWTDVSKIKSKTQRFDSEIAGSTYLANATLESFTQAAEGYKSGCFSCHAGATGNNTARASHLLTAAEGSAPGLIERCDVKAGAISDDAQAKKVCPKVCRSAMGWNGNWTTLVEGSMSVCGCNACPAP